MLTNHQQEDIVFLKDSDKWPAWPLLPIKRSKDKNGNNLSKNGSFGQAGVVLADDNTTVYLKNLFEFEGRIGDCLDGVEKIKYQNLEEMLLDGWMVD